ncbi:transcription initiation factor TFIID subunit 1 isoform X1 [Tripterygium wilfordii]|uniref:Transcription initiation factor TFIID subunit 1 n=1 Tax=Tripterygium wilfordii TaxID=458696 RepID=A0A7J7CCQ8_TRIWF|nr:transcription initiation factor TFIID subunit 1-like [Tripterygium wilfordii]XP_038683559.1 transcription initiation factor TFIID subunit 1-like [Tripterygium wilfordii]KAF5731919.1 transcription initiation factor TFIID subunit 1 isoform X1 [Tripterygium wilfordii]
MGYEFGSSSQDGRDEDDEEEYEEAGGGNKFLGFMFGNVDNSGDLDADYLDEDAKEHLAALADKLGHSLTEIDMSVKSPQTSVDAAEQDYDEKAENAVDYEDIEEEYDGPEIQAASEEDFLLPKKEYFGSVVSQATLKPTISVFDDENYDDDEEFEKDAEVMDEKVQVQTTSSSDEQGEHLEVLSKGEVFPNNDVNLGLLDNEVMAVVLEDFEDVHKEVDDASEGPLDGKCSTPLPILCVEDGMVILRFSEIFGIHQPLKKGEKSDHKHFFYREKYQSMDISDIAEEDEEACLKAFGQGISLIKQAHLIQHYTTENDDGSEEAKFGALRGAAPKSVQGDERRKNSYICAEPMKEDLTFTFYGGWQSPSCPRFYPLDQEDWEDRIVWDDSSSSTENCVSSCDIPGAESEGYFSRGTERSTGAENFLAKLSMDADQEDRSLCLHTTPLLLESFGSNNSSVVTNLPLSERGCHPQLLRLESRLDSSNFDDVNDQRAAAAEELHNDALRFSRKLTLQNTDMMDGSWVNDIIWEPHEVKVKPKLILDLQDEQMLFEILDNNDSKHLQLHAGAMILAQSMRPSRSKSPGLQGLGYSSGWQFNIANDRFYKNRKIPQQLQSNANKRIVHGIKVYHSAPAIKLQTMKLKLSNKDLAYFHRPKALWYPHDKEVAVKEQGKLPTQGPMKIILKSLGGKGSKLHVDAEETMSSVKAKASKKLDFKPSESVKTFYLGKELEDNKSLVGQNVQPNSLLHLVRTRIHLLPRAQKTPASNKSLRPPGAFKKKSDLSVKDGHVFLMEYCEERPLLLSNAGMGANLCTYYQKSGPSDQSGTFLHNGNSSLGNILSLEPADKSPFLGDIKAGCSQSSIETNMYKAPIFPHKVPATDFLLVRSAKGKLSIRRIDRIAVVGQQEPLMEVMSPGTKGVQTYMTNRLLVYVYREFRAAEKRGLLPCIRTDELSVQFPNLSDAILRKKLKECAILRRDTNGKFFWSKKRDFHIPSEEELKKLVSPENVCAYESMQAGLYRLKHLGITRLTNTAGISSAMSQLPDEAIALAAASHIERELQITPWSLSSNFVACTNQDRENLERLEISGVGDPSGRGLGFSYVRTAPKAPMSNAMTKKKAAAGRGGSTVTGTDADLRRLSMEAAREVLLKFNVPDEHIEKLTRWHRIAMIRRLSSEQAAAGVRVDPTTISKYARGQRMSFLQLQQQTREKCQEVWDRQIQSLSAIDGDDNESESEANSDLDSFAGDLENLLDAEEYEEGEEGNNESKHEKLDGVKGLKMRRRPFQAQVEEEIEDEAAEAAELFWLLMDDDDVDQKKKKKKRVVGDKAGSAPGKKPSGGFDIAQRSKKNNPMAKQISSTAHPNGSFAGELNINSDSEAENFSVKRNMFEKVKAIKKNDASLPGQIRAKVKILGDGSKMFKEKKSSRESFFCGACGQLGHMKTNKNCPRYGEDPETQLDATDFEKSSAKPNSLDPSSKSQQKVPKKKITPKSVTKVALPEVPDGENKRVKTKVVPLKFTCGSMDKLSDTVAPGGAEGYDRPVSSDVETGSKSVAKVNKLILSNKLKPEVDKVEQHKPSIVIRPPVDTDKGQVEYHKPSIVIKPPINTDRDQAELHKRTIVIRPPAEKDREQPHKKIIIKRPKEIIDLDQVGQDGSSGLEYRKTKRIVELSSFDKRGKQESIHLTDELAKRKAREEKRLWEEEEKRRNAEIMNEERARRLYEKEMRMLNEQEGLFELKRYEEAIRKEREEEERQKAKKKKKRRPEISDEYLEDYGARRNYRRVSERDRSTKRRPVGASGRYGVEYAPPTKRHRGGEVGLANILELIVEALKGRLDVSYLFLKPVSKKEAPDYLDIIDRPMDLATIKEKVRRMEYKSVGDFRHDVSQITYNAHKYNDGRNPGIPPLADQLLELCDGLLEEHHEGLLEAEASIRDR